MDTSTATKGAFLFDGVPIGHNPHTRIGNPVRILAPPNIGSSTTAHMLNGQVNGIIGYNVAGLNDTELRKLNLCICISLEEEIEMMMFISGE